LYFLRIRKNTLSWCLCSRTFSTKDNFARGSHSSLVFK